MFFMSKDSLLRCKCYSQKPLFISEVSGRATPLKKWKPWCIIIIPVLQMKAMFSLKEHTSIMILLVIRTQTNISNEIRSLHHGHIPITPTPLSPSPRAMSSAVSSNRLSLCGHTSSCTVALSSRQAFANDVALLTPTDRAKCPIWRCKLLTPRCRRPPARCDLHLAEDWSCLKIHGFTWISTGKMMIHSKKITLRYFQTNGYKWSFHQSQWGG